LVSFAAPFVCGFVHCLPFRGVVVGVIADRVDWLLFVPPCGVVRPVQCRLPLAFPGEGQEFALGGWPPWAVLVSLWSEAEEAEDAGWDVHGLFLPLSGAPGSGPRLVWFMQ
jgi:hypothetical protein